MQIVSALDAHNLPLSEFIDYQRQLLIETYTFAFCTYEELESLHHASTKMEAKLIVGRLHATHSEELEKNWRSMHDPDIWHYTAALSWDWDAKHEPMDLYK